MQIVLHIILPYVNRGFIISVSFMTVEEYNHANYDWPVASPISTIASLWYEYLHTYQDCLIFLNLNHDFSIPMLTKTLLSLHILTIALV